MWVGVGRLEREEGAIPVPGAPSSRPPPSCDVSARPLRAPLPQRCPSAPRPRGQAPSPAQRLTRCPGGACNAAAVAGTWGRERGEEGKEEGRRPLVPLFPPRGEARGPILLPGTPRAAPPQPSPGRHAAGVRSPVWGVGVIGGEWLCVFGGMWCACGCGSASPCPPHPGCAKVR